MTFHTAQDETGRWTCWFDDSRELPFAATGATEREAEQALLREAGKLIRLRGRLLEEYRRGALKLAHLVPTPSAEQGFWIYPINVELGSTGELELNQSSDVRLDPDGVVRCNAEQDYGEVLARGRTS